MGSAESSKACPGPGHGSLIKCENNYKKYAKLEFALSGLHLYSFKSEMIGICLE